MLSYILKCISTGFFALVAVFFWFSPLQAQEEEETYSISLTKTAEVQEGKGIHEVGDKKVLAQEYTVQSGDHVWQLFRERGLLQQKNLGELLSVLKKMNKSLTNLDLIHPGEKIIIPLKIAPLAGTPVEEETVQLADLKDINFQNYTVKKDDYLIKVVRGMYNIPQGDLYGDYLNLVKKLNPSIDDLDTIRPGQTVRLPIYSPQVLRVAIESEDAAKTEYKAKEVALKTHPMSHDLAEIVAEIGEEWIQSGEHFIPLKTGGQINLKAASFPIINLRKGPRVIVDLENKLPTRVAGLIESSWNNYSVVHLSYDEDLRTSLDKIIKACRYPKVFKSGEPLELGRDISFRITGDWIIKMPNTDPGREIDSVVITLRDTSTPDTPGMIRKYLAGAGVKIIDYPPGNDVASFGMAKAEILKAGGGPLSLTKTVLDLTGTSFSLDEQIPVYQSRKDDIKMIIRADFSLKAKGKDAVIDLTGLAPEVVALLEEQHFQVLSMANENDPVSLLARTCEFLGISFQGSPLQIKATARDDSRNIILTLPGIVFSDSKGDGILATPLDLPEEINAFLSLKGYRILRL